ncbi:hypothetical protein ACIQI8_23400 [Streptomyces sp. NPDC092369]|uniref:hypothetical protein n=1 Tax=Streptomyces sp. NPDC092369 TaxID=3366015 RepID=UPI00382A5697
MKIRFALDTDSDPTIWLGLPIVDGRGASRERKKWARRSSELLWSLADGAAAEKADVKRLAGQREAACELLPETVPVHQAFIFVPDPRRDFLMFVTHLAASEGATESVLPELVQKDAPGAIQDPEVIDFDTDRLGRGTRSIRYFESAKAEAVCCSVNYAWRIESHGVDLILRTVSDNLGWVTANIDEFDEFARSLWVLSEEG